MVRLPEIDRVQYLLLRRFPSARLHDFPPSLSNNRTYRKTVDPELRAEVEAYRRELGALGRDELEARYTAEQAKAVDEAKQRAEEEERKLWFHQPTATADFDHWAKAAHWTLDEAIALSFGKAPEAVSWKNLEGFARTSPFAFEYGRRRDLAWRAVQWKQLFDPVLPGFFLAWAKRNDIPVVPELEAAVAARGVQIADWKTRYDDLKASFEKERAELLRLANEQVEVMEALGAEVHDLRAQLAAPPVEKEKTLGARDRESLLKLVIGMALRGYTYDPTAARSPVVSEIVSDLELAGVSLSPDTVLKWLRQAAELLPPREPSQT